jgi:5'-3' exoribonuclease 2
MPPRVLDDNDRQMTRGRASRSGRSYGGAPLRRNYNNGNYRGREPPVNYSQGPGPINRNNPFAAHLNPNFDPSILSRGPPPPHMAAAAGWIPPPPPGMNMPHFGGRGGPPGGFDYGRPPVRDHGYPPPRDRDEYRPSQDHGYGRGGGRDRRY